jgi:glycosyltransferase involved in cell wall biosynthesis
LHNKKRLSLIIPIYNSSIYLKKVLRNIVIANYSTFYEILLVNDCSNDDSLKLCLNFKYKNPKLNIKIINNKKNLGVGASRNIGIKVATSEYLAFIDSDDIVIKDNLLKLIKFLKSKSKIKDVLFLNFEDIDGKIKNLYTNEKCKNKNYLLKLLGVNQNINYCFQYIYNKKFLTKNKLLFEELRYAEDLLFITKVFCLMKTYKKLNISLLKHTYNKRGLTSKINIENDSSYLHIIKFLEKFEKKNFSKLNYSENEYIKKRKKNCLEQFLIRCLKYDFNEIISFNKKIIKKTGNISVDSSFLNKKKYSINLIQNLNLIQIRIINFIKNLSINEAIGIYGYGVVGRSVKVFLNKIKYKNFIFFDDKVASKVNVIDSTKIYNIDKFSCINLFKIKKIIICIPHLEYQKKIYINLVKKKYLKKNILKLII